MRKANGTSNALRKNNLFGGGKEVLPLFLEIVAANYLFAVSFYVIHVIFYFLNLGFTLHSFQTRFSGQLKL